MNAFKTVLHMLVNAAATHFTDQPFIPRHHSLAAVQPRIMLSLYPHRLHHPMDPMMLSLSPPLHLMDTPSSVVELAAISKDWSSPADDSLIFDRLESEFHHSGDWILFWTGGPCITSDGSV